MTTFNSLVQYTGDGVRTRWQPTFAGGYISPSHVYVVRGTPPVPTPAVWEAGDVNITPPIPNGEAFSIQRRTPPSTPIVDFLDGTSLTAAALDTSTKQAVFLAAEALDRPTILAQEQDAHIAAVLAAFPGTPGVPGGNVMAIGPFSTAGGTTIATGTDLIQTARYATVAGLGAALYSYDAAVDAAYVTANPRTSFLTANARGFRLYEGQVISPEMFGAVGDGVVDDGVAVNAMFSFCLGRSHLPPPSLNRTYAHSIPLVYVNPDTVNYGDDSGLCTQFHFDCTFIATAAMDHMLTFRRVNNVVLVGRIRFTGGPNNVRTNYLAANGLYIDACGGSDVLVNITGHRLIYGVYEVEASPSNNNLARVEAVRGYRFGASGVGDIVHTANFSARVDTGGANSEDQKATYVVDSMPPAYTDAVLRPVFAVIGGFYYRVVGVDRGASTVSLRPWPSTAVTAGTLRYAYGAAASIRGGDGNLINIGTISSQGGAGGVSMQALYGGTIGTIHCEFGGIAVTLGSDPASTILGLTISRLYCEGTDADLASILYVPEAVDIPSASPFDYNKVITASVSPGGAAVPTYGRLPAGISINGKSASNARRDEFPTYLAMDAAHNRNQIWCAPTATPAFDLGTPPDASDQLLFNKPFRMSVEVPHSIVTSGTPTSVTFNAPAGWTVNGGASAVFTGITGIPEFSISMDYVAHQLFARIC